LTLEERLRLHAAKGELVQMSVVFTKGVFYANLASTSPADGYSQASDADPVQAIEKAFGKRPGDVRARDQANPQCLAGRPSFPTR